jgi:hypothetical protein
MALKIQAVEPLLRGLLRPELHPQVERRLELLLAAVPLHRIKMVESHNSPTIEQPLSGRRFGRFSY